MRRRDRKGKNEKVRQGKNHKIQEYEKRERTICQGRETELDGERKVKSTEELLSLKKK